MSFKREVEAAREDLRQLREDCSCLIEKIEKLIEVVDESQKELLRLITIPILYAVWERVFCVGNTIRIKVLQKCQINVGEYPPEQRAVWLLKEKFFQSFKDSCLNKEVKANALTDFLSKFDRWHLAPFNSNVPAEELLLTRSNVNKEVLNLNAKLFGLAAMPTYSKIDVSRLDELVGRRNDIGHGGTTKPPGEKEFVELIEFTKQLLISYTNLLSSSLRKIKKNPFQVSASKSYMQIGVYLGSRIILQAEFL